MGQKRLYALPMIITVDTKIVGYDRLTRTFVFAMQYKPSNPRFQYLFSDN